MVAAAIPAARTLISAEEFLCLPDTDGLELVDGAVQEKSMGFKSAWIGGELLGQIRDFPRRPPGSVVAGHEAGIAIWPDNPRLVRKPDVLYICPGRLTGGLPDGWLAVVPDLVVEVVSPREEADELRRKILDYRRAGVPHIWVIYPASRTAEVWRGNQVEFVAPDGTLDGGAFLAGFGVELADLLARADAFATASV